MQELLKALCQGAYEREEAISLALLTAIAGESIFLLGRPGVGKSMVARRLKMAFKDAKSFEYLMSRFSTPDEIFGPVSITKLKDQDTYERVIEGYLPTADVVFLDEIWKAGPAIQNSLFTALNERIFRNGNHDVKLPLKTIISASNELPAEGEGLEALWDRFLVRYIVEPISRRPAFLKLLTEKSQECSIDESLLLTDAEFSKMQREKECIGVPDVICDVICDIRGKLTKRSRAKESATGSVPYVSDRRWRKIVGLLRTSAMLNGRMEVDLSDCLLLEHLIWDADEQLPEVKRLVADAIVACLGQNINRTVSLDDFEGMRFAEPVGNLLCPDGKHYVFAAGGEDVLIAKSDYALLGDKALYGEINADNKLVLTGHSGAFAVRKRGDGCIVLNTFAYQMKRDSPLRSGNSDTFLKVVNANSEKIIAGMKYLINENLLLRTDDSYAELNTAFESLKYKKSNFKNKR